MKEKTYAMFAGEKRNQVVEFELLSAAEKKQVPGEELVTCSEEVAHLLRCVPSTHRWEAAQGEGWSPSPRFADYLRNN